MKVLIAGSNGYIGCHVTQMFAKSSHDVFIYCRDNCIKSYSGEHQKHSSELEGYFDVVINCARPHWSQYSAKNIADIESKLLARLDKLASQQAMKIHTSGVWLFGHATPSELVRFQLKPFDSVRLDVATINTALNNNWHIVYCPSLVYGGENCQLLRITETLPNQTMLVAVPTQGFNQYIHVNDIAKFYRLLVSTRTEEKQHFIAESIGYSPEEFSMLLLNFSFVKKVSRIHWEDFERINGTGAVEIEKLHLELPISPLFKATESVQNYVENHT
ncbi:NAD(P)-dependent oxidoreductase [Vibrio sp. ZSDE26]|uniref:NAD(P)-dependent oxidoreductase n=1 Tax=Vibrio amylolyticus TaxID=2847292 RepID=A0A9X1XJY0_9VIBR|nr:NAD(P)-dependent oxidoreductase [Vibrio amylolyticus]MCK6264254.1 NAD(P)-dependent oxidoreductase [Vibrio amylolyticus]